MDIFELARLLQNLIRLGTVTAVRHSTPSAVRIKTGELETNWIPFLTLRAGDVKTWCPPSVGEQVVLLSPGGELTNAVALTGLYSDHMAEPSNSGAVHTITYPDGAEIKYDHGSSALSISGINTLEINASGAISINAPQTTINGIVTQSGGPMSSNGIVVDTHKHAGVIPGGSNTQGPV
ncbi:phage baseplate assembly protein V [Pelistega sp. MC2]|uniref:phage baseplate assembly protein V n=1 Tax=Pelistega sp. MC2 TaxID=1720297 RepID=UPI0008DA8ABF|nr:phage baseplate assembly protein V [Pelistega sp. MC2]